MHQVKLWCLLHDRRAIAHNQTHTPGQDLSQTLEYSKSFTLGKHSLAGPGAAIGASHTFLEEAQNFVAEVFTDRFGKTGGFIVGGKMPLPQKLHSCKRLTTMFAGRNALRLDDKLGAPCGDMA